MKTFEQIIKSRKTVRNFTGEIPSEADINYIAQAAVYAPYGGATGIPFEELRRIVIFKRGTESMKEAERLIIENVKKGHKSISGLIKILPFLKKKMGSFSNRLKMISENGIPALRDGGYFIVIAERKGFPPVAKQSLAHAMENMWLAATEKGLGFQMVSATGQMSKNKKFMNLLKLETCKYDIDGCVVGIASSDISQEKSFDAEKFVNYVK